MSKGSAFTRSFEGWFPEFNKRMPNMIMDTVIECPECGQSTTRKACKAIETSHNELIEVTFQIVNKYPVGINYYCECGAFLRHDVHYETIELEENE